MWIAAIYFALVFADLGYGQANIVLRDLTVISDREVKSFSQESIRLSDDSELSWGQVLKGTVTADRQAEFDQAIRQIGLPLFRMNKRIEIGDWNRLSEVTEQLMIRYSGVDSSTAKTVCLAACKGKLETGRRAAAVLPFLMACGKPAELDGEELKALGFVSEDFQSGVSSQLLPVWFDLDLVAAQKSAVSAYLLEVRDQFSPGGYVYLSSFCLSLGQFEEAAVHANKIEATTELLQQWKQLLLSEVDRRTRVDANRLNLFRVDQTTLPGPRAASNYFDAVALDVATADEVPASQMLAFLKVTAIWSEKFPSLSSAAIYRAIQLAQSAKMKEEADSLTAELLRRFAKSYHGEMLASQIARRR